MHRGTLDFCLFTFYWEEANWCFIPAFQLCLLQVKEWCITVLTRKSLTGPQESCFKSTKKSTFLILSAVCYVHHPSYWACPPLANYTVIFWFEISPNQFLTSTIPTASPSGIQHYLFKKCVQAVCKASAIVGLIRRFWLLSKKHSVGKP